MTSVRSALADNPSNALPDGVRLMPLTMHADERGDFTELFRNEWYETPLPVQWNVSRSNANVLRGMQVHALHWDYFCVIAGEMLVGLHDLRPDSPTHRESAMLSLIADRLQVLAIPPGVVHGFYAPTRLIHVIGASRYYLPSDHRRCRWDCPELALDWPCTAPDLSAADRNSPGYSELREAFLAAMSSARSPA